MIADSLEAEIEAAFEKDRQQLQRKIRIISICVGVFLAAILISSVYGLHRAGAFQVEQVVGFVGILGLYVFSVRCVSPTQSATRAALFSLYMAFSIEAFGAERDLYDAGRTFLIFFPLMFVAEVWGAWMTKRSKRHSKNKDSEDEGLLAQTHSP